MPPAFHTVCLRCTATRHRRARRGFTLIEALTVIAVLAIVLTLAAPNLRDFLVRNKVAGLSNEFSAGLLQARALAVSQNSCVTLCAASSVSAAGVGTCNGGASPDYQAGWMIFKNPSCSDNQIDPTASGGVVLAARQGESNGYQIKPGNNALGSVMFDPRGTAAISVQGLFQVLPPSGSSSALNRTVCVDASGRASIHKYSPTACL